MEKPRLSIVTPSFNQGNFLEQCICSVLDQNYSNLEYSIIDGGSTDNSVEIIKKYEKYLSFWVSKPDDGQSDAINKGWRRTTGEMTAWINSDDFYLPGAFNHAVQAYQKNPDASFYFGNGYRVNKAGNKTSDFFPDRSNISNTRLLTLGLNYILQPAVFINKKYLLKADYLNTALHYTMDFDLWIRLSRLAEPVFISEFLAAGREYETTKTSTGSFERIAEMRRILEKHTDLAITPGVIWYFMHTLREFCAGRQDIFSEEYIQAIETFTAATADLFKPLGGRPDGFPFGEPTVYGIYPDAWTSDCIGLFYGKQQGQVKLTLKLPKGAPTSRIKILFKNSKKKYTLSKWKTLTIQETLAPESNYLEFLIHPVFRPEKTGGIEDIRKLGCLCTSFKLITKNGEQELLVLK